MVRELIADQGALLKDVISANEMIVASADLPDDKVWLVIVVPPDDAHEIKVMG